MSIENGLGKDCGLNRRRMAEDSIILILNDKCAFKGYSYLLVADGKSTLASVVIKDLSKANLCFKTALKHSRN